MGAEMRKVKNRAGVSLCVANAWTFSSLTLLPARSLHSYRILLTICTGSTN